MGDDEFFSTGLNPDVPRNPLTLDELTVLSRKLLNIAFTLYWRDDPNSAQETVPGMGQVKWENVREKATKCLQALHAREYVMSFLLPRSHHPLTSPNRSSRRPFTPPDHWLVTSHVDMNTFISAAVYVDVLSSSHVLQFEWLCPQVL